MKRSIPVLLAVSAASIFFYQNCSGFETAMKSSAASNAGASGSVLPPAVADNSGEALPATSGTPLIHQIRAGKEIATYSTLGSIFKRVGGYRLYETGDVFELDPAVYSGPDNNAWIGTQPLDDADYQKGNKAWLVPTDLVIRGRVVNGYRPVVQLTAAGSSNNTLGQGILYLDNSKNITIENIDFDGQGFDNGGKGAIYINGVDGFTLRHSRVMRFTQTNGVFSTGNNVGTILFENVETGFNGGDSGPEHNYYMGESNSDSYYDGSWGHRSDANHTIIWRGCYSHDVYYGHTIKSRAAVNIVEASYLKGKNIQQGQAQGEAYLADFPNGGRITIRNSVLDKGYSGDDSNGIFITYAMEGNIYPEASESISIVHNTFVARSTVYDSQGHLLRPMNFFYPGQNPKSASFPVKNVTVAGNLFVGFETNPSLVDSVGLYRGDDYLELSDLNAISAAYALASSQQAQTSAVGQIGAAVPIGSVTRQKSTFGAID
jgi:hypothetical protein